MLKHLMLSSALALSAVSASAAVIEFNTEYSGATAPAGTAPWATLTIENTMNADEVQLTWDFSGLTGTEFASDLYFNIDPFISPNVVSSSGTQSSLQFSENAYQADGDGFFDGNATFANGVLGAGSMFTLTLSAMGLDKSDFLTRSFGSGNSPDGLYAAIHVQGIGDSGANSGWITGAPRPNEPPLPVVPLPGTALMLMSAIGLVSGAAAIKKRLG